MEKLIGCRNFSNTKKKVPNYTYTNWRQLPKGMLIPRLRAPQDRTTANILSGSFALVSTNSGFLLMRDISHCTVCHYSLYLDFAIINYELLGKIHVKILQNTHRKISMLSNVMEIWVSKMAQWATQA